MCMKMMNKLDLQVRGRVKSTQSCISKLKNKYRQLKLPKFKNLEVQKVEVTGMDKYFSSDSQSWPKMNLLKIS